MRPLRRPARDPILGFALLGLLHKGPAAGYDLRRAFTATPLAHFSDSPGAIYPALRRLERRGWIERMPWQATSRRRRQPFRITPAGRRALLAWLRAAPTREEIVQGTDVCVLRLAFMSQALPAATIRRYLVRLRAEAEAYLGELERFLSAAGGSMTLSGRLAFESGLEGFRAFLCWADRAQRRVDAEMRKGGKK